MEKEKIDMPSTTKGIIIKKSSFASNQIALKGQKAPSPGHRPG